MAVPYQEENLVTMVLFLILLLILRQAVLTIAKDQIADIIVRLMELLLIPQHAILFAGMVMLSVMNSVMTEMF